MANKFGFDITAGNNAAGSLRKVRDWMTALVPVTLRLPEAWYEFNIWRATRTGDLATWPDADSDRR